MISNNTTPTNANKQKKIMTTTPSVAITPLTQDMSPMYPSVVDITEEGEKENEYKLHPCYNVLLGRKKNAKKVAVIGVSVWGAATGIGWAMQNYGTGPIKKD